MSGDAARTAGILLLSIVAIEYGGLFVLRVTRRRFEATPFQRAFFRAGHAHAGVLVTLGLVCQLLIDSTDLTGAARAVAAGGIPLAAILMPAGFFLSAAGPGRERPNRLIVLLYLGAASLAAGAVSLGIGLVTS